MGAAHILAKSAVSASLTRCDYLSSREGEENALPPQDFHLTKPSRLFAPRGIATAPEGS